MIGQIISHYKILEKLGEGGMGAVYKARDTKLDRLTALKFLPAELSALEENRSRFFLEARAAASLNHANICTIYGIEEIEGRFFIAMEFVDGHTLKQQHPLDALQSSPLPVKQAIDIVIQIAEGLAAASEKGIVHRDIKPENIMIRKNGIVQIMDFGVAKLSGTSPLTKAGSVIGTVAYMSPEQVQGIEPDHRSDVFSLGVVLYELLTARSPFKGFHETSVMYEIVNVDPPLPSSLRADLHPELDRIVVECLQKDREERFQSAREVSKSLKRLKRELEQRPTTDLTRRIEGVKSFPPAGEHGKAIDTTSVETVTRGRMWFWTTIVFALIAIGAFANALLSARSERLQLVRSLILPPDKGGFYMAGYAAGPVVLSPDGTRMVFLASNAEGKRLLWVRPVDEIDPRPLPGTEGSSNPFWAPDSRTIGFFSDSKLKRISIEGGGPVTICEALNGFGGTWNGDGLILFAPSVQTLIHRVSSSGGVPAPVTVLDTGRQEMSHRWPQFLPDGKHFVYYARTIKFGQSAEAEAVFLSSIDTKESSFLAHASSNAVYVSGYMLFARGTTLVALPFDPDRPTALEEAIPIVTNLQVNNADGRAVFSVAENNLLVYQSTGPKTGSRLLLLDRKSKQLSTIGEPGDYWDIRIAPDGKRFALSFYDPQAKNLDIWIQDLALNGKTRFTFHGAQDRMPVWSPDGRQLLFMSNRDGSPHLYYKELSGVGGERAFYDSKEGEHPSDWSPDGTHLLFTKVGDVHTRTNIWVLPLAGERKPLPFLATEANEWDARFSPDGKWVVYNSDESGRYEIYLLPFLREGAKWQISTGGGWRPRWRNDGRELFYMSLDSQLMAVEIDLRGQKVQVGRTQALFQTYPTTFAGNYDVSGDGRQIIVNSLLEGQISSPLTLVANWTALIEKK